MYARTYCEKILVQYEVSKLLSKSYIDVANKDSSEILQLLLMDPDRLPLIKEFIRYNRINPENISKALADRVSRAIVDSGNSAVLSPTRSMSVSGVIPLLSTQEKATKRSSTSTPVKAEPLVQTSTLTSKAKSSIINQSVFQDFLGLTTKPELVGKHLLDFVSSTSNPPLPPLSEVEILIRAHFCFLFSSSIDGCEKVLRFIKKKVPEYIKAKQFKLLVRLVTGTKQYNHMQYIMDLLIQHDQFELFLSKNVQSADDKKELQMTLYNYLKKNYPTHTKKLELLFLHFTMYREFADTTVEKAIEKIKSTTKFSPRDLIEIMDNYLLAAENYTKERCYELASRCIFMVSLIELQFRIPETRILNLNEQQAKLLMHSRREFKDALIVANAYNLNNLNEWSKAVYQQVVCSGNFAFYEDLINDIPLESPKDLFEELVKKHKSEPSKNLANFKKLLEKLPDIVSRYLIAEQLGFSDVCQQILAIPGIKNLLEEERDIR
eukprot:TRINITY_DN9373_c0_g1_i1.p1 TRINITY_DN9373_c0_g1~~TRINITY_DN9373_c0_g1_i1.p1  ORF type:complete len:493 (-),score=50.49 TRINITY_DN9373_c0_g1_i1:9-1487(-)